VPKKNKTIRNLKKITIPYSQIKIKEKAPPLNSTLNPETSSLSPSEKSKGVRLLSAKQTKIHPQNKMNLINKNQNPL
jgi:hypothetical protein